MKTSITLDSAGRIVLPVEARRRLNLRPGSRLSISILAERIELAPEPEAGPALKLSPSGRRVLASAGGTFDAAAAVRAERDSRAVPRKAR